MAILPRVHGARTSRVRLVQDFTHERRKYDEADG